MIPRKRKKANPHRKVKVVCPSCHQERWIEVYQIKKPTYTGRCIRCSALYGLSCIRLKKGVACHNWRGGVIRDKFTGYVLEALPDDSPFLSMKSTGRYVLQHRLVVAQNLRRCLCRDEIIHHLNGIKDDNRVENLAIVDRKTHEHGTLVWLLQKRVRELEAKIDT